MRAARDYIAAVTMHPLRDSGGPCTGEPSGPLALDPLGTVRFVRPDERDTVREALDRAGWVVAELDGIGPSIRGRLGDVIDDAIEGALRARGEAGPGVAIAGLGSSASLAQRETALSDQMYRARRAGAKGIAVVLGPLRAAAGPLGALEPQDCATLRWLAKAAPSPQGPAALRVGQKKRLRKPAASNMPSDW